MKIGILTFHCAHNYGAVLQCYALQETLSQLGHKVEIIDYRPQYLLDPYNIFNKKRIISKNPIEFLKNIVKEFLILYIRIKRYNRFNRFIINRLNLSHPIYDKEIPSNYDVYIMGSDQIWNPQITNGFDDIYFGQFLFTKKNQKYIAYAASMEVKSLSSHDAEYYKNNLKNFNAISVREKTLAELLQPLSTTAIQSVIDPTLLINSNIWGNIIKEPKIKNKKYVLVYQVRYNSKVVKIAQKIAKQINGIVIELSSSISLKKIMQSKQSVSPEEFLGYIKNASFVITTSFHGTAFSIIFKRPFYCIQLNDGNDTRSSSLLNSLGLSNRMLTIDEEPKPNLIEYESVYGLLNDLRKQSLYFLRKSI